MAEVLMSFDNPVADESGTYHPRVVGRLADDGMWEGWLEFDRLNVSPRDDGEPGHTLVGPVESRQPEREHLVYWATGLTPVYMEGALHRARRPVVVRTRVVESAASDEPATRVVTAPPLDRRPEAVLDPFEVGGRSLDVLRQELGALHGARLLNIIAAYDLNPAGKDLSWMTEAQLVHFIVVAVEAQLFQRAR